MTSHNKLIDKMIMKNEPNLELGSATSLAEKVAKMPREDLEGALIAAIQIIKSLSETLDDFLEDEQ